MTKRCYVSNVCDNITLFDGKNITQITVNFVQ